MREYLIGAALGAFILLFPTCLTAQNHSATRAVAEQRRDAEQGRSEHDILGDAQMFGQQHRERRPHRRQGRHPWRFGQDNFGGLIYEEEEKRQRKQFPASNQQRGQRRWLNRLARERHHRQEIERREQSRDDQHAAARRGQFPPMGAVKAEAEESRGYADEDGEFQERTRRNLRPQADDERDRTPDDQQPTDQLAPPDAALFHEGFQHFGE